MIENHMKRIAIIAAALFIVAAFGACAIQLRGEGDQLGTSAQATRNDGSPAAKLARCRAVTYGEQNALTECQKIWAEKRRQFLGQKDAAPSHPDNAAQDGAPASSPDGINWRQAYPFAPKEKE